jgi:hypothetical protein
MKLIAITVTEGKKKKKKNWLQKPIKLRRLFSPSRYNTIVVQNITIVTEDARYIHRPRRSRINSLAKMEYKIVKKKTT